MKVITAKKMQDIDRKAQEEFGVPSIILMENAGRGAAEIANGMLAENKKKVVCVCGKGNNGGDGFVCARHLINQGIKTDVLLIGKESDLKKDAKVNFQILKKVEADIYQFSSEDDFSSFKEKTKEADLIVDAIFGIGISGEIRKPYSEIIELINESNKKILAVDVPSGLDATEGKPLGQCIKADKTATFAAAKTGLVKKQGPSFCGEVVVVDISVPQQLLE